MPARLCCTDEVIDVLDSDTELQKSIKQEIIAHDLKAAQLRAQLNSLLPIARIPPEVLLEVFLFQTAILHKEAVSEPPESDYSCNSPYYKWMNVSQVCGRWRQIALDCTSLWTWLALDQRTSWYFPKMFIERARNFPLTVMITVTDPRNHCSPCLNIESHFHNADQALLLLGELVPRIRELVVFVDKDDPDGTWDSLTGPADVLEDLRIEAFDGLEFTKDATGPASAALPTVLFASKTPRLHSLTVVGFDFELSNSLLDSGLRHLEITSCLCGLFEELSNLGDFLAALRAMPLLETLKVDWSLKALESDSFEPVHLRSLKLLHLSADALPSKIFLNHLRLPRNVTLHFESSDVMQHIMRQQLEALGQSCLSFLNGTTPRAVWYGPQRLPSNRHFTESLASCRIWVADKRKSVAGTPLESPWTAFPPPQPRLIIDSRIYMIHDPMVISALRTLDLSAVHTVCLEDFAVGNKWARGLRGAHSVMSLRVLGEAAFGLPAVLARGVPMDTAPWQKSDAAANEWHWVDFDDDTQAVFSGETGSLGTSSFDVNEDVTMADTEEVPNEAHGGGGSSSTDPITPLFPRLNTIVFVGVDFAVPQGTLVSSQDDVHGAASVLMQYQTNGAKYGFSLAAFSKCLRMRRAQGASGLVRVEFEGCRGASVLQFVSLAQVGVEVWWDRTRLSG